MPDLLDPLGDAGDPDAILGDESWLRTMVEVEVALVRALEAQQLLPPAVLPVAEALSTVELDAASIASASRLGGNPVIPLVMQLGSAADRILEGASDQLHLGATSQDILDSAAMTIGRRVADRVARELTALIRTLAGLADTHRSTPMSGRTLGQHASPVTFGLVVAGWLDGMLAARERLVAVGERLPVQYGGAVGSRAILYELVRERRSDADADAVVAGVVGALADSLDLRAAVPWQSNRMPIVELGSALAAVVGAVGWMAADLNVLSRTEIAEVSERLGAGEGGSSAMPHKRNPVTSVLLVSAARRSPGLVATLFQAQVTEDQRSTGAWHSEWQTLRELERLAIQASATAADLAERIEVDVARMRTNLEFTDGLITSATADEKPELIEQIVAAPGGNKLGEFSMTDARLSRIDRFMASNGEYLRETQPQYKGGGKQTRFLLGTWYKER